MSFDSDLASSLRENQELIEDLCRYSEGILTEKQVRQRWHLANDEVWTSLGADDFVERVELERTRRIRSGATKRELAQLRVVKAPDVLEKILSNERVSPRHRIDAAKTLDDLAGFAPQRPGVEQDRVVIRIDLSADTKNPADVLTFEAVARPQSNNDAKIVDGTPQERAPMIAASEQFDQDVIPVKRGPGRPKGSRNKSKAIDEDEPSVRGVPGFDVSGD